MQTEKTKRYEKLSFLGEGQVKITNVSIVIKFEFTLFLFKFATVYKARDKETGIIVAVKKV
jgi:hypothetical protein